MKIREDINLIMRNGLKENKIYLKFFLPIWPLSKVLFEEVRYFSMSSELKMNSIPLITDIMSHTEENEGEGYPGIVIIPF